QEDGRPLRQPALGRNELRPVDVEEQLGALDRDLHGAPSSRKLRSSSNADGSSTNSRCRARGYATKRALPSGSAATVSSTEASGMIGSSSPVRTSTGARTAPSPSRMSSVRASPRSQSM